MGPTVELTEIEALDLIVYLDLVLHLWHLQSVSLDPMICPACTSERLTVYATLAPKVEFYKSFLRYRTTSVWNWGL
jgi:hypothetical protein